MKSTTLMLAYCMLGVTGAYGQENELVTLRVHDSAQDSLSVQSAFRNFTPGARLLASLSARRSVPARQEDPGPNSAIFSSSTRFPHSYLTTYPSRSLQSLLIQVPGIAEVNGNLHVRGSRKNQTGYVLNGFNVLDRYTNTSGIAFIPEAMESVTAHTGVYDASLGMNGGGIVEMRMKEGGDAFHATAKYITDNFRKPGEPFLDTYSYGWNTAVATIEGPLPFNTNFFVAGEIHRARDRQPRYVEPMYYEFVQDNLGSYPQGTPLPGPFVITKNHVPSNTLDRYAVQWNLSTTLFGVHANLLGSISKEERSSLGWFDVVGNYYRQKRIPRDVSENSFIGIQLAKDVTEDIFVRASVGFSSVHAHTEDPDFGENWLQYADSAANAAIGYGGFVGRYSGPYSYSTVYNFSFSHPSYPNRYYDTRSRTSTQASIASRWRIDESMSLHAGVQAEWWKVRSFEVFSISAYTPYYFDYYGPQTPEQKIGNLDWSTESIGYDVFGQEIEEGLERSRTPFVGALYATLSYAQGPFRMTAGVRQQFVGQDNLRVKAAPADALPNSYPIFDRSVYPVKLEESQLEFTPVVGYFLPRGSLHYEKDDLAFSLNGGMFLDAYGWGDLYRDLSRMASRSDLFRRVPYNLSSTPAFTYLAQPERTSMVETALRWSPARTIMVSTSMYKKYLSDQLQQGRFSDGPGTYELVGLVNKGESSIFGWETGIDVGPLEGFTIALSYAFSDAQGKAPDPSDWFEVSDEGWLSINGGYPDIMLPLPYGQKHRVLLSLAYEGQPETALQGVRAGLFGRYVSGHPYTRESFTQNLGSATVWRIGTRTLQDVRGRSPIEPYYASEVPPAITWDLHASYRLNLGFASVTARIDVTNLLDTKNIFNVYPSTGSATTDGWMQSPFSLNFQQIENYVSLYTDLNYKNGWAYNYTGNDIYGPPRQIRFGVEVEL